MPPTIVLIHGLYLTSRSWDGWIERFQGRGYNIVAPSWPGLEGEVEQLNRDPSPIAGQKASAILDHYEQIIRGLDTPPIIMGHSFGGAFTQVLVDRGLGAAAATIESGTIRGVRDLPISTLKANLPLLRNPLMRHKAIKLTPEQFNFGFTNTFLAGEAAKIYETYAIPGSRSILFEGAYCNLNSKTALKVDFTKNDRAPLLFIAGGEDHIIPLPVNKHNVEKYSKSTAVTDYKEYPGRAHFTMKQDGWEEIADYALSWATEQSAKYLDSATGATTEQQPTLTPVGGPE